MLIGFEALRDLRVAQDRRRDPARDRVRARAWPTTSSSSRSSARGSGWSRAFLGLMPEARVGHLGIYRDEKELQPVGYYESIPDHGPESEIVLVDPMLATGGSAVHALTRLKERGAQKLRFVCLVAAPEGLAAVRAEHPDVPIFCAAVDRELDERGYIRPGLGDAGDRLYGTD